MRGIRSWSTRRLTPRPLLCAAFLFSLWQLSPVAYAERVENDPSSEVRPRCFVRLLFEMQEDTSTAGQRVALLEYQEEFGSFDSIIEPMYAQFSENIPPYWIEILASRGELLGGFAVRPRVRESHDPARTVALRSDALKNRHTFEVYVPLESGAVQSFLVDRDRLNRTPLKVPWSSIRCGRKR